MIDIAFGLQEAVKSACQHHDVKALAHTALLERMSMSQEEMMNVLFALVVEVATQTSYNTVCVTLTDAQQNELAQTIDELNEMGNN